MVAFALARAIEDLENRAGNNSDNWAWGKITKMLFGHQPCSAVGGPLDWLYSVKASGERGNRRSINMKFYSQHHATRNQFENNSGSNFRIWSHHDYLALSMDLGVEAAISSPYRTSFKTMFDRAEYTYWRSD